MILFYTFLIIWITLSIKPIFNILKYKKITYKEDNNKFDASSQISFRFFLTIIFFIPFLSH